MILAVLVILNNDMLEIKKFVMKFAMMQIELAELMILQVYSYNQIRESRKQLSKILTMFIYETIKTRASQTVVCPEDNRNFSRIAYTTKLW